MFQIAVEQDDVETVRKLLTTNAVNVHVACGWDPKPDFALRYAAGFGHTDMVRVLLEHKADIHALDHYGVCDAALIAAAVSGHTETVRVLLHHKAEVNIADRFIVPDAAVRYACMYGHAETVRTLIEAGASVHSWIAAKSHGHKDTAELLVQAGVNASFLSRRFVKRYLLGSSVDNIARCMRFGTRGLNQIARFDMHTFRLKRNQYLDMLSLHPICRDLCTLVLLYV